MKEFRGPKAKKYCRSVDIMADAAYAILIKDPVRYTGNLCFDEDILKAEKITDLEQYRAERGRYLHILHCMSFKIQPELFVEHTRKNIMLRCF